MNIRNNFRICRVNFYNLRFKIKERIYMEANPNILFKRMIYKKDYCPIRIYRKRHALFVIIIKNLLKKSRSMISNPSTYFR